MVASLPCRADLSLNCVIRDAWPKPVKQPNTQASCVCAGTWLCTKIVLRAGSIPSARYWAAVTSVRRRNVSGSCARVMACRSTTQKNASWSSCNWAHWVTAPSAFPRWSESEVGCTPEKTRLDPGALLIVRQSFHANTAASCSTGGIGFSVGHCDRYLGSSPRAHPSRLWRTRPAAASVPDLPAGVGDRRPATGRHRPL